MGEFHWVSTVFGALIMSALFIGGVTFLTWALQESTIVETKSMLFLNKRAAMHIIEDCLHDNGEYITDSYLDSFDESKIQDACGIRSLDVGLKIKDMEQTRKEWVFDYDDSAGADRKADMFMNIKSGDEVHVGKIFIEI